MTVVEQTERAELLPADADRMRTITAAWLMRTPSTETRKSYRVGHLLFAGFCAERGIVTPAQINRGVIDGFRAHLEAQGFASATVRTRLAAVSSWLYALVDAEVIATNPAARVQRPPVSSFGSTPCPPVFGVREVLAELWRWETPGLVIAVELMARNGLRVSEASTITARDVIRDSSGTVLVTITGKGGARSILRTSRTLGDDLLRLAVHNPGRLFCSPEGKPYTNKQIHSALDRASRRAGVSPPIRPHQLRVFAITTALDAGHNIDDVATFARHADVRTTRRYDRNPGRRTDQVSAAISSVIDNPAAIGNNATIVSQVLREGETS